MNKKVIKLTEADLYRIVKRVITEENESAKKQIVGSLMSTDSEYVNGEIKRLGQNLKTELFRIVDVSGKVIRQKNKEIASRDMYINKNENFIFVPDSNITVALYKKKTNPKNPTDFHSVQFNFGADKSGKLYVEGVGL